MSCLQSRMCRQEEQYIRGTSCIVFVTEAVKVVYLNITINSYSNTKGRKLGGEKTKAVVLFHCQSSCKWKERGCICRVILSSCCLVIRLFHSPLLYIRCVIMMSVYHGWRKKPTLPCVSWETSRVVEMVHDDDDHFWVTFFLFLCIFLSSNQMLWKTRHETCICSGILYSIPVK